MIRRIVEDGRPVAEVAAGFGSRERTARKWLSRWRAYRAAGLENRSSLPLVHAPCGWIGPGLVLGQSASAVAPRVPAAGEETASRLGLARSTVAGWLTQMELDRIPSLAPKGPVRRYQRERPGELLRLDIKK